VYAGEIWLDNRMTAEVMKAFSKSSNRPRRESLCSPTAKKEIVQLVAQGFQQRDRQKLHLRTKP
jgi:DNA-binding NarL/FixJ family response regulator